MNWKECGRKKSWPHNPCVTFILSWMVLNLFSCSKTACKVISIFDPNSDTSCNIYLVLGQFFVVIICYLVLISVCFSSLSLHWKSLQSLLVFTNLRLRVRAISPKKKKHCTSPLSTEKLSSGSQPLFYACNASRITPSLCRLTKHLSQNLRTGQDSNQAPLKYK